VLNRSRYVYASLNFFLASLSFTYSSMFWSRSGKRRFRVIVSLLADSDEDLAEAARVKQRVLDNSVANNVARRLGPTAEGEVGRGSKHPAFVLDYFKVIRWRRT
jgi:hypothetical protein